MAKTLSIVIPVYNEERYLAACLESIAVQTQMPAEVIVVDNNSTDKTALIAAKYPFVKIIKEKTQGTVFARNAGFNVATGEIIGRIDADTILPADWCQKTVDIFANNSNLAGATGAPEFYDVPFAWLFNKLQICLYQYLQKTLTSGYVLWGANMAIKSVVWQRVSSSTSQRLDVDEDVDLTFCLQRQNLFVSLGLPPVQASFQRGDYGIISSAKYLSSWPRDYMLHKMYVRALLIYVIIFLCILAAVPFRLLMIIGKNR